MMKQRSDYKRVYFCRILRSASSTFTFGLYIFSLSVVRGLVYHKPTD